jgi:hypothetical protein
MPRYDEGPGLVGYLLRFVLLLVLLAGIGLVGFAYFGDLSRPAAPRMQPVSLGGN